MLSMEVGITRKIDENTNITMDEGFSDTPWPTADEAMSIEEMILGYTINNATQLCLEDKKGSIEVGKDADFLIFDEDLLTRDPVGLSYVKPSEVWFAGKLIH